MCGKVIRNDVVGSHYLPAFYLVANTAPKDVTKLGLYLYLGGVIRPEIFDANGVLVVAPVGDVIC